MIMRFPIIFLKTKFLELEFDEPLRNLIVGNKKQFDRSFCYPGQDMKLLTKDDIYYVVATYEGYNTRVFREDIRFPETAQLKIHKSEARNHIKRKALNIDGSEIMLNYYYEYLIREYPNGFSSFRNVNYTSEYISDRYFYRLQRFF
jgi:hypothetical protein